MSIKKYDVIVIGAGNGGLVAATTAAKMNLKTLLIEKHNVPGGFATSFVRGRFEFEPSLHELCDLGTKKLPGSVYHCFDELGINVNWLPVPEAYSFILKDENNKIKEYILPFGIEKYCQAIEKYCPGSYNKVKKFMDICLEIKETIIALDKNRGMIPPRILKQKFPNYLTTAPYSLDEVLTTLKMPKLAKNLIEGYWLYLGLPPRTLSFHLYGIMLIEYIKYGAFIPTNRSHEISQALATRFEELGGTIWFNTVAEEIVIEKNNVKAIKTNNGIIYTEHIISNVSPHIVYGKLIKPSKIPTYDNQLTNWRQQGTQGYCIYLGLNVPIEKLGLTSYSYFVFSSLNYDDVFKNMKSIDTNCEYIVTALNVVNKDASPKNTSIISFTTLYDDAWNDVQIKDYFKIKNEVAQRMIKDFEEKMNINITKHIEEIEVATPITFARYTGTINGAIYGYPCTTQDSILIRSQMMDEDVTINGLRFVGGNAFRAHGYSTTYLSGYTMASKTFLDIQSKKTNLKAKSKYE